MAKKLKPNIKTPARAPKPSRIAREPRVSAKQKIFNDRAVRAVARSVARDDQNITTGRLQREFQKFLNTLEKRTRGVRIPVVGIGASAGGLEACAEILSGVPRNTGMAYVVVQHLEPRQKSHLAEILARATSLPVKVADHLMAVEPDTVYVIPPNRSLAIANGLLHLLPRFEPKPVHMVVDFFFRSLAEENREKAIGIVLSGGDGDGAIGLKDIKGAGGVTFVQDPLTAKVPSMPATAEEEGAVDHSLSTREIARELGRLARHPVLRSERSEILSDQDPDLAKLFHLLREKQRVDFSQYKRPTILRRIRRRMLLSKTTSLGDYFAYLQKHPGEIRALHDDLLINVTSFFRDPEVFSAIAKELFPKILRRHPPDVPIRIWIPGCSGGEEAYSFAILLTEEMAKQGLRHPVQIFATDISEQALQRARIGQYPSTIRTDVSIERLRNYFVKNEAGYRVTQAIRDLCVFAAHDVTEAPPFSRIDLISCRNLLIYLGPVLQKRVMGLFAYALNDRGYLVLGSSEAATVASDSFSVVDKQNKIYQRKVNPSREQLLGLMPPHRSVRFDGVASAVANAARGASPLEKEMHRLLLRRYRPAAVVVGEDGQIVQFYGDTAPFLEHGTGTANLHLLKMARGNLQFELRKLLRQKPRGSAGPITRKLVLKTSRDAGVPLALDLYTLDLPGVGHYRVLFFELDASVPANRQTYRPAKASRAKRDTMASLREELSSAAEDLSLSLQELELANEELQSANEEILSSNEELQSTNEELETAKEELQSTNEELTTVNEELAGRNAALSHLNDDLQNLLASVNLAIVMVGNDLRIRRFTPMSEKLLNLIPSDVGRPITDFNPNFNLTDLRNLISDTIDANEMKELPLETHGGQSYLLRIRPYRTAQNKTDGAVLVFLDLARGPGSLVPNEKKMARLKRQNAAKNAPKTNQTV